MNKLSENFIIARPYQNEAIFSISDFVKNLLRGILEKDLNKVFQNAALLNMATGSGKTFTIGTALNNIIKLRNRFNGIKNKEEFEKLNIVVLTHRIDLVNQFRDDLVYGRDEKAPILTEEILNSLHVSTYHSKADKDDNILDNEEDDLGIGINKDNIIFSTYQTAGLERIVDRLDYVDIILIDESHNVKQGSEYEKILKELALKTRIGAEAIILPVTATPNNQTRRLFGQEIFDYGLEKYLNSEYSPSVEYNLVTNSNADKKFIEKLSSLVEESKHTEDIKLKKELIKEAEELFGEIISSFVDNEALVDDLFERAGEDGNLEETVVFCNSIKSADEIAVIMNKKIGIEGYALSFHSKNDTNNGINKLRDKNDPCKVILSIGKLNEGIDLPKVKNVVFWRGTDSETIFFQQFGRGLRGNDLVKYFDYVGGMKNFAWINEIFVKYNKNREENEKKSGSLDKKENKYSLLGGNMGTSHHNIDLVDVGLDIVNTTNNLNYLKSNIINYLQNINGNKENSYRHLRHLNFRQGYKKLEYNGLNICKLIDITGFLKLKDQYDISSDEYEKFLSYIFDMGGKNQIQYEIEIYFKSIKLNEDDSYNYLMGLNSDNSRKIEYKNHKIKYIMINSGWSGYKKGYSINLKIFRQWVNWIFGRRNS